MSDRSEFSIGLGAKICGAWADAGGTPTSLNALAEKTEVITQVLLVLIGQAIITIVKHVVDCNADPFTLEGWKVKEHHKGGQMEWDPEKVKFYLSENQLDGKVIEGNKLHKELAKMRLANACLLDYLLAHPELIPDEWKGKLIFFWGTIYRNSNGNLCVRYLYWNGDRWEWGYNWLGTDFLDYYPAAVLAS